MEEYFCPVCGEESLKHWNQGVYECSNCQSMFDYEEMEEIKKLDEADLQ